MRKRGAPVAQLHSTPRPLIEYSSLLYPLPRKESDIKPIIRRFTYATAEENDSGRSGWVMKGFETLNPTGGFGVAHDALEHFDSTLGPEAELLAFGTILWGRYNYGFWRGIHHGRALGYLVDDWVDFFNEGARVPRPCPGVNLAVDDTDEHTLRELEALFATRLEEWVTLAQANNMVQWVRKGIHASQKRFQYLTATGFMEAFHAIEESKFTRSEYESGTKMTIRVSQEAGAELFLHEPYW